jgi:hypothetical protein
VSSSFILCLWLTFLPRVASGYGATDDGMGVVSLLQIIKHFTTPGQQPEHGIVALFNNCEEDGLYGARVFGYSPLLPFCHTFVNLEGAGAGGRAVLFQTTDKEVTEAYSGTPHPFGSVLAKDAFQKRFIRSQTDYIIWNSIFGQRGMDIAFYRPRARYHTNQDDLRHTSKESLYHMYSAALHSTKSLSGDTGDTFVGKRPDGDRRKVDNGQGEDAVWFDLFGSAFVVFGLRQLFAWCLTLLIASPLILILLSYFLARADKYYLFSGRVSVHEDSEDEPVNIRGWRGLMRLPFALIFAGSLAIGSALLIKKVNPLIVYSSEYSV